MKSPTFDSDGYPSDETLRDISYWYTFNGYTPKEFLEFCEGAFNKHYGSWKIVENYNNDLLKDKPLRLVVGVATNQLYNKWKRLFSGLFVGELLSVAVYTY